jgi:DGQHR domain-containing protein
MNSEYFELKLIKVNQCLGINFYSGSIRLKDLFPNYTVPVYKSGKEVHSDSGGYQREAKKKRVYDVKERIINVDNTQSIPNTEPFVDSINLNIRSEAAEQSNVTPINKSESDFGDVFKFSYVDKLDKFYVVDGQTRLKGAHQAYLQAKEMDRNQELADKLGNIRVQLTLTFCTDKYKEAYIFYLINQYAKAIPTEGATRLLYEGSLNNNIHFSNEVIRAKKDVDVECMSIVQRMLEDSNVWSENIADFNDSGGGKINIQATLRIIKPLHKLIKLNIPVDGTINPIECTYDIIEAFWNGFKDAYPEMFELDNKKYNIMKAGSAEIMMLFLTKIYETDTRSPTKPEIGRLTEKNTYLNLLKKTLDNFQDGNLASGNIKVSGSNLFLVGERGAMGQYGNASSKKAVVKRIFNEYLAQYGMPVA